MTDGTPKLLPKLDTMIIRRVIPPIDALPVQIEHIQLREVLPPYNSTPGGASGLFYLVSTSFPLLLGAHGLSVHSVQLHLLLF